MIFVADCLQSWHERLHHKGPCTPIRAPLSVHSRVPWGSIRVLWGLGFKGPCT